jgi:GNAT superfamily N-acetyltransferase
MAFNAEEGINNSLLDVTYALIDSFNHPTLVASYLAYHDQQLIGYFHLTYTYSFEYLGIQAILDELFLKPAFRGQGFATALLKLAASEAKQQGANHLAGISSEQKPWLLKFYTHHGFKMLAYKPFTKHL